MFNIFWRNLLSRKDEGECVIFKDIFRSSRFLKVFLRNLAP